MPRKTLDRQHNGRYVNRYLSGVNNFRKFEAVSLAGSRDRYCLPMEPGIDRAIIRNPHMKPLIHKGKK